MGDYYSKAYLVVSALTASSDDQGFLSEREPSDTIGINIHLTPSSAGTIHLTNIREGLSLMHPSNQHRATTKQGVGSSRKILGYKKPFL